MAIRLPKDTEQRLLTSIKQFFREELEEEIGDLKARIVLDYCLREIAPSVYNQAVADAQAYFQEKVVDLDATCHEPEFGHWKR